MTSAKLKRLFMACLAIVFCFSVFGAVNPPAVSAKSVSVGSSLFTDINNISMSATTDGLELSTKGQANAEATFLNKLYMGDFSMGIKATELNFQTIKLTFLSRDNADKMELVKDIENVLELEKTTDGKITAKLNNGSPVATSLAASGTIFIRFNGNATEPVFTVSENLIAAPAATFSNVNGIYFNEAKLKIALSGIPVTNDGSENVKAAFVITEINGQSFIADDSSLVNDNKPATLRLPKHKLFTDSSDNRIYAKLGREITIPAYGMDVISSSFTYEMKVQYYSSEGEEGESEWVDVAIATGDVSGLSFTPKREGKYRIISITAKDGNDNDTSVLAEGQYDFALSEKNPINITSVKSDDWSDAPPVIDHAAYFEAYNNGQPSVITCTDTNIFRFKRPDVAVTMPTGIVPTGIVENPESLTYAIKYKLPSSSSWQSTSGLDFSAKHVSGEYCFYIQVTDRWGNVSKEPTADQYIRILFKDQTAPKIVVSSFPETKYVNQSASLPSGVVTDLMDSSLNKQIQIYMLKDEDGNVVWLTDDDGNLVYETDDDGNEVLDDNGEKIKQKKLISSSSSATFTPKEKGLYEVIYSVEDTAGNKTELTPFLLRVIDAPPAPAAPFIDLSNPWTIVLLSIAGLSLIGIVVLLFVKPAEEK